MILTMLPPRLPSPAGTAVVLIGIAVLLAPLPGMPVRPLEKRNWL